MKYILRAVPLLVLLFIPLATKAQIPAFYVATAINSTGSESIFSNQAAVSIPQQGTHTVVLTWTESDTTAVAFNVYRGKVSGGPYVKVNTSPITALTFTDTFSPPTAPVLGTPTVN